MKDPERVCPWWFCRAKLNQLCIGADGMMRKPHQLRRLYISCRFMWYRLWS